eukprot:7830576-Pyramimonas_sp.AAC.1
MCIRDSARVAARTVPATGGRAGHRHDDHDDRRAAEPEPVLERAAAASDAHAHVKCSAGSVPAARYWVPAALPPPAAAAPMWWPKL